MAMKNSLFGLHGELVGQQTGHGHPQDDEGSLAVFLVVTREVEVGELGLGPQGAEVVPGDLRILAHCSVDIPECLNGMALPAKFLVDPV